MLSCVYHAVLKSQGKWHISLKKTAANYQSYLLKETIQEKDKVTRHTRDKEKKVNKETKESCYKEESPVYSLPFSSLNP